MSTTRAPGSGRNAQAALLAVIPYAVSRVHDMHEEARETHGCGKEYRCLCYIKAAEAVGHAIAASGDESEASLVFDDVAKMREDLERDPPASGGCQECAVLDLIQD